MIVYIVTDGSYSDYHICAVFTDKLKAEQYAALHGYDDVEEYETDKPLIDGNVEVYYRYYIDITKSYIDCKFIGLTSKKTCEIVANSERAIVTFSASEKNDEKAIKIAQDMLAEHRAKQAREER